MAERRFPRPGRPSRPKTVNRQGQERAGAYIYFEDSRADGWRRSIGECVSYTNPINYPHGLSICGTIFS